MQKQNQLPSEELACMYDRIPSYYAQANSPPVVWVSRVKNLYALDCMKTIV